MSRIETLAIFTLKSIIVVLGGAITFIAYKAYLRTKASSLRALAFGFGVVTTGALSAGIAHQALGVSFQAGVLINSVLTVLGFSIIIYSLHLEE